MITKIFALKINYIIILKCGDTMEPIIKITDLTLQELSNFNLQVKKDSYLTILGPSKSGKNTLVKIICGILKCKNIEINPNCKVIGVFSPYETPFVSETVLEELFLSSVELNENKKDAILKIADIFKIQRILNKRISKLTYSEKQILSLVCSILMNPNVLVLDNIISNIDYFYKDDVLNALKIINKKYKITIINLTNNSEESLFGTDIAIINNGKLVLNNKKSKVLLNENNFIKNNLEVPFIVDLSIKLKYYDLIDEVIIEKEKLVDKIWN